jgi:hypothetical protein
MDAMTRRRIAATLLAAALLGGPHGAAAEPEMLVDVTVEQLLGMRQQPLAANLGDEYRARRLEPDREAFADAFGRLAERQDVQFREAPLADAVAAIAAKAGVRIGFDREALEAAGIDTESPVTASFGECSAESALRELLADMDLALVFRNERIVVTTVDAAAERRVRWLYPLPAGIDVDAAIALVTRTVTPQEWDTVGGEAVAAALPPPLGSGIVVVHHDAGHRQVLALFAGLDAAAWQADVVDDGVEPRHVRAHPVADELVRVRIAESLVETCNAALPHGADPGAEVAAVGDAVLVRSKSRAFHVLAAQLIAAIAGSDALLFEGEEDAGKGDGDGEPAATGFRGTRPGRRPAAGGRRAAADGT